MNKYFELRTNQAKQSAINTIQNVPLDSNLAVRIVKKNRTLEQNSKMWAMLAELEEQVPVYFGVQMTKEKYKDLFTGSLSGCQFVPAVGGHGMVGIGGSSSKLTTSQMADLITMIEMFGAENGVVFKDQLAQEWRA